MMGRWRLIRRELSGTPEGESHVVRVAMLIAVLIFVVTTITLRNPNIEGAVFPVMANDFEILAVREVRGGSLISAQATKRRKCIWEQTLVYKGVRGERIGALLTTTPHRDPPEVRDTGLHTWQRIFVPVPPDEIGDTYADVIHTCNGRQVRSKLWG